MNVNCEKCSDTGWVYNEDKNHVMDCICKKNALRNKMIPWKFRQQWDPAGYKKNWIKIVNDFLKAHFTETMILVLWGLSGRGKTRLAYLTADVWVSNHKGRWLDFEFIKTTELERHIHLAKRGGYEVSENLEKLEDIKTARFLIIDDFWSSPETTNINFLKQFNDLFDILQARKIVITMNVDPENENIIDVDTAFSRIHEKAIIEKMGGFDRRLNK